LRLYKQDDFFYAEGVFHEASAFYPALFGSGSSGLGFGDMYANTSNYWFAVAIGHVLLGLQVLLGYVLLGALVTRFGVLFTSGLIPGQFKEKQEGHQKV